jgi:outer membrane protein
MTIQIRALSVSLAATLVGATALAGNALAQANTVKAGLIYYQTHAQTTGITGVGVPPGADAEVGNATTVLLTYERELAPNIGIELVLGWPPKIKASGAGTVPFLGEVLTAKNIAPTLLVNYHFGDRSAQWRPYVGLGVNYTYFADAKTPYGWDVNLSSSWGVAAQAGIDYAIDKQWGLFASIAKVQVKSDLVAVGAAVLQTTIDFRPVTYAAGVSYKF